MSFLDRVTLSRPSVSDLDPREREIDSVVRTFIDHGGLRDVDTRDIDERVRKTLAVQRWRGLIQ